MKLRVVLMTAEGQSVVTSMINLKGKQSHHLSCYYKLENVHHLFRLTDHVNHERSSGCRVANKILKMTLSIQFS